MKRQESVHEPPTAALSEGPNGLAETVARALIRRAAHRAPPALSERLEEEWFADLATRQGPLARVLFAAGCRWAARTIALEFGVPVRVAAAAAGSRSVAVCDRPSPPSGSPRLILFVAIVGFHALLIYAFATSLTPGVIEKLPPPLRAFFIQHPQPPVDTPRPMQPVLTSPTIDVPPPLVRIDVPTDSDRLLRVAEASTPAPQPLPSGAKPVHRVVGGPGPGFPNTEDFYSSAARRLGEEGVAAVRVCVDDAGRLTAAPAIVQSSGSMLIDDSALRLARAGVGHYRVTTEDGRPVSSCYPFRIRFQIRH